MKKFRGLIILFLTIGVVLLYFQPVLAFPPLPSSFYGAVKINGANVTAGTVISAKINGVQYASTIVQTYQGDTVYSLDVPGEDPDIAGIQGGVEGDIVVFFIGTIQAIQTGTWHQGTNTHLNLTGFTVEPIKFTEFLPLIFR
jgi:hypothetical protein